MEETSLKTPEMRALQILEDYEGSNNFILNLKHKKFNSKTFTPTRSQSEYIINYQNTKPKVAKKWVKLDSYFAKKLKEDKMYTKEPSNGSRLKSPSISYIKESPIATSSALSKLPNTWKLRVLI